MDYLGEIKKFHSLNVEPFKGKPKGCSPDEIRALEQSFKFELPLAYKQFLEWMGKDYNGIFVGCDWFMGDVASNTEIVPDLLEANGISFELPENYLCFFSHQGYMVAWFELPKLNDNPPVWFYGEGQDLTAPTVPGTFTSFLLQDMRGMAECLKRSVK